MTLDFVVFHAPSSPGDFEFQVLSWALMVGGMLAVQQYWLTIVPLWVLPVVPDSSADLSRVFVSLSLAL